MTKIIRTIRKITGIKTQPIHNLNLKNNHEGNEFEHRDFVEGSYSEGTVQASASDNLVVLVTPLSSSEAESAHVFNLVPTGDYLLNLEESLNQFKKNVGGLVNYFTIRFYGAHKHKKHTLESLITLYKVRPSLAKLVDDLGFVSIKFNSRFGEENRLTNIVYDVSEKIDFSCTQPSWLSIGGIPLHLPTTRREYQ